MKGWFRIMNVMVWVLSTWKMELLLKAFFQMVIWKAVVVAFMQMEVYLRVTSNKTRPPAKGSLLLPLVKVMMESGIKISLMELERWLMLMEISTMVFSSKGREMVMEISLLNKATNTKATLWMVNCLARETWLGLTRISTLEVGRGINITEMVYFIGLTAEYTLVCTRMDWKKDMVVWSGLMELSMKGIGRMEFKMEKENYSRKVFCRKKANGKEALSLKLVLRML
jgi:hypothetical protein